MAGVILVIIVVVLVLGRLGLVSKKQTKARPGVGWFALGALILLVLFLVVLAIKY